jgi:hypothetical protein
MGAKREAKPSRAGVESIAKKYHPEYAPSQDREKPSNKSGTMNAPNMEGKKEIAAAFLRILPIRFGPTLMFQAARNLVPHVSHSWGRSSGHGRW